MERLTKRLQSGASDYAVNMATLTHPQKSTYRQRCVDRLAAYEDTGLEPEQIKALAAKMKQIYSGTAEDIILDMKLLADHMECEKYRALGPVEELTELVKARDEGRVVVLDMPRKPLVWGDNDHDTCLCPDCGEDLMGIPCGERMVLQCPACGQYLDATKIITRAEAEAALNGGGGDG